MSAAVAGDPVAAARSVAEEGARAYQRVFTERFVAAYALGSLAHGGYAPAVSDIDLAVLLTDVRDGDAETVAETGRILRERGEPYRRLSVFWGSVTALSQGQDDGRFPAIDRLDLAEHGLLLLGSDVADRVAVPDADELLVDGAWFALTVLATDEVIAEVHQPRRLLHDPVWFTKAVLFPVRFFYSSAVTMGRAATNGDAIRWYLDQPGAVATPLVRLAAAVRAGAALREAEAAPLLAAGLRQLYRRYAEEQAERLRHAGAPDGLVAALTRWRGRLGD
ncbi:hypothetical protein ACN28C_27760 [Plantactinospora sp. WMMC1484]|uniref:hypothetical protein n=1 Tax=Plantactinospora sp. WMMC1484 TaxID=3404122 RepID=UPI003BF518E0